MIKATEFKIEYSEAPGLRREFATWEGFAGAIRAAANDHADCYDGGGYKTDFSIVYADGSVYTGNICAGASERDVVDHIRTYCEVFSGQRKPRHWSDEDYQIVLSGIPDQRRAALADFLNNYEIGGSNE